MTAKAQPCQHASYCPRRMRDGDHIGCADRGSVRGCTPTVEKSPGEQLAEVFFAKQDPAGPYCRRCGADVKATAWRHTERFMARCACGSCDVVFPMAVENNQETD